MKKIFILAFAFALIGTAFAADNGKNKKKQGTEKCCKKKCCKPVINKD